jgi:hypothetical protein
MFTCLFPNRQIYNASPNNSKIPPLGKNERGALTPAPGPQIQCQKFERGIAERESVGFFNRKRGYNGGENNVRNTTNVGFHQKYAEPVHHRKYNRTLYDTEEA